MFGIFHPRSNASLKASLALMHMATFILRNSNLEWQEKGSVSVMEFIFGIRETFHTNRHTHIHTNLCSILSEMG